MEARSERNLKLVQRYGKTTSLCLYVRFFARPTREEGLFLHVLREAPEDRDFPGREESLGDLLVF